MSAQQPIEYKLPQIEYDPLTEYVAPKKDVVILDDVYFTNNYLITTSVKIPDEYNGAQFRCTANNEFMNTSLGGHIALGVPYANTPLADPPRKGVLQGREDFEDNIYAKNMGMGTMWGDEVQLRSQPNILYLEFGKPKHRNIFSNFANAVDYGKAIIANEGRTTFFYTLGQGAGEAARWAIMPGITAAYEIYSVTKTLVGGDDFRYYSFKPDMHNYLQTANNILTQLQTERGLIKFKVLETGSGKSDRYGVPVEVDASLLKELQSEYPDIMHPKYGFNIYNIIARPQLMVNELIQKNRLALEEGIVDKLYINVPVLAEFKDAVANIMQSAKELVSSDKDNEGHTNPQNKSRPEATTANIDPNEYKEKDKETGLFKRLIGDFDIWTENFHKYKQGVENYGMEYIALYVTYDGGSTISFSNEVKDIPAKSMINSIGSASRDIRFNFGDGKFLGDTVDSFIKAGRDVVAGTLSKTTFGLTNVIAGLVSGGYLSFPKMWSDSSVSLPSHSFSMRLGGPYSNPISNTMDIDVILSLILGGSLPLSIGDTAYTSPYLCKAFIRGVLNIDFGMITSVSLTSSSEKNVYGAPLYIDLKFGITDFSDIATASVNDGLLGIFGGYTNEYDVLSKYIRGIGGRSYTNTRYVSKSIKYKLAIAKKNIIDSTNPAKYAAFMGDTIVGDFIKFNNSNKSITRLFE